MNRVLLRQFRTAFVSWIDEHVYWPHGRLIELLSLFVMCNWLWTLSTTPGLFERAAFVGFSGVSQDVWIGIFGSAILFQITAIFWRPHYWGELRFLSIVITSSIWVMVTANFIVTRAATTATGTYMGLAVICTLLGARLAWKASSYRS